MARLHQLEFGGNLLKALIMGKWPVKGVYGGVAVHTLNLITAMSKLDDLNLYFISFGKESKSITLNNARIILIKTHFIYYVLPFLPLLILKSKINLLKPDIIQIQGSNLSPYLIYGLLSLKRKLVLNIYGIMFMETYFEDNTIINGFLRYVQISFEKYAISKISEIIVESQFIKNIISKKTKSKIHVISDGVNIAEIQSSKMINSRSDIFLAARLVKLKGIDILIKSLPKVKEDFPNLKVFIAGEGPQKNDLILLAEKLGLNDNVIFLGYISEKEKFDYYKSSKIVIVPSRWDCSPIGIYEAMGAGKAVIASDNTNSDILENGKTGLIFESENFDSLADRIILLLKDKVFREEISKSAENIAKNYDWSNIARSYFKVYQKIID